MKSSRVEKYNSGRIATATAVATLLAVGFTHQVDGCADEERASAPKSERAVSSKKFGDMNPVRVLTYIYKEGDPVDAGIIAVNGSCSLYTDNTDVLEELREEVAPNGLVYPGEGRMPMLPCSDLDPHKLPPRVHIIE